MIDTIFKPNRSKCGLSRHFRLMRNNNWTSNGYWAMLTSKEPRMVSQLATTDDVQTDLSKLAREFDMSKVKELRATDILVIMGSDLALKLVADGFVAWVKPHFLTLMRKAVGYVSMYSSGPLASIYFVENGVVLGIVMPIRANREDL